MNKTSTQLKSRFSRRGLNFADEIISALIDRVITQTSSLDPVALANGEPAAQNALLAAISVPPSEVAFARTVTLSQGVPAAGEVVFTGLPADGNIVTMNDGTNPAVVFEFDAGTKASGTLSFAGQPADTNSFTLDDGITPKIFEFDSGVTGVASTGAVLTFNSVPTNGSILTLKKADGTPVIFQFKTSGLADAGKKYVYANVSTAALVAKEFIGAINGTGPYFGNGVTGFAAVTGGAGIVNLVRTDTGAGNETIVSGTPQVETATAVGTITTTGNATVVVTGVGITGTPLSTSVAVVAGTAQVETGTVVGTIDVAGAGNATVIVTAAGMAGSPITVPVAVANSDTASQVATKVRAALALNSTINAFFTISGAAAAVILTAVTKAANDATMNISFANGTCTGLTSAPTSSNTTPGVTPDTAALWAGKVRTALGGVGAITALYTVGGAGADITLTRTLAAANDATLNISLDNGTCVGITTAATSVHTTAGSTGLAVTVTSSFSGGVTAIAAGAAVTAGHVGVAIGASVLATRDNLIAAINAITPTVLITASIASSTSVTVSADSVGTGGNSYAISKSGGNLSVSGANLTGGAAAGSGAVTGSNTAVAIGATAALTATALHTAINAAASLDITSTNSPAGHCVLANTKAHGASGNHTITKTGVNFTVTGMVNGADSVAELISDAEVGAGRKVFVTGFLASVATTNWADANTVKISDNDDVGFITLPKSILVTSAPVYPSSASVTRSAPYLLGTGGTTGFGLKAVADVNEETGGALTITVSGVIKGA